MKSVSHEQLRGNELSADEVSSCEPIIYNKDIKITDKAVDGTDLDENAVAFPCGIAARSYFNDTFVMRDDSDGEIPISSKGIAWNADVEHRYLFSKNKI